MMLVITSSPAIFLHTDFHSRIEGRLTSELSGRTPRPIVRPRAHAKQCARLCIAEVCHGPLQRLLGFTEHLDQLRHGNQVRTFLNPPSPTSLQVFPQAGPV